MPRELTTREDVEKLLPEAREIRLVRGNQKKNKKKENNDNKTKDDDDEHDDEEEADNATTKKTDAAQQKVKMKLRTERTLYTFKTTEEEAQALIKGQKIDVVEF